MRVKIINAKWINKFCIFLTAVIFSLTFSPLSYSREISAHKTTTFILDLDSMSNDDRSEILKSLGRVLFEAGHETITVKKDDNLYSIVAKTYKYSDRLYPVEANALVDLVREVNNLSSTRINAGQQLNLPILPQRPRSEGSSYDISQLVASVAPSRIELSGFTTDSVFSSSKVKAATRRGKLSVISLFGEQAIKLLESLSSLKLQKAIRGGIIGYLGPTTEVVDVEILGCDCVFTGKYPNLYLQGTTISPLVNTMVELEQTDAHYLYVLDFFHGKDKNSCTHGQLVLDQIQNTLTAIGCEKLIGNVKPIEIDFFSNRREASEQIKKFIYTIPNEKIRFAIESALTTLQQLGQELPEHGYARVPLLYLRAVFENLVHQTEPPVAAVTSSFWTLADTNSIFPNEYSNASPPLISAVGNEPGSTIEAINYIEPQATFYKLRREYPVILVGAEVDGKSYGMFSEEGDGVTFVEHGRVLGRTGTCVAREEKGTSFAAPIVATYFLLADAVWRKNGVTMTTLEARMRMLLSCDIVGEYVDKYAAGGKINLQKLLLYNGAYVIGKNGDILSINFAVGKLSISIKNPYVANGFPLQFIFGKGKRGDSSGFFQGLKIIDNKVYLFTETDMRWKEVIIENLNFQVLHSILPCETMDETLKNVKEVFIL